MRIEKEALGVLDDPPRIDAGVVGDHVACKPDAAGPRPCLQVLQCRVPSQLGGDRVVGKRVGRCLCLGVSHPALDLARGRTALPDADEPQRGEAGPGQPVQLLVGHLVQRGDGPAVLPRELRQPDQGVLRHHHRPGHPVKVGAERLALAGVRAEGRYLRRPGREGREAHLLFLAQDVHAGEQAPQQVAEKVPPAGADELELACQRVRGGFHRAFQEAEQVLAVRTEAGHAAEELAQDLDHARVCGLRFELGVVEQLHERCKAGVVVGKAQQEDLLEGAPDRRLVPPRQAPAGGTARGTARWRCRALPGPASAPGAPAPP